MAISKYDTGDIITKSTINNRTWRSGTTTEIDNEPDSEVAVGVGFFDTTLAKPKFVTQVSPRKYHVMSPVGTHQLWVDALACFPATTNPCGDHVLEELATNDIDIWSLPFAGSTTNEVAKFNWVPPENWDVDDRTIKIKPYWTADAGAGTVEFEFSGVAISNDDPMDAAFGTAQASLDTFIAANDLHVGPITSAITIGGTPADADWVQIKILRDQVNDTKTEDAKLLGFILQYSIDFPNSDG